MKTSKLALLVAAALVLLGLAYLTSRRQRPSMPEKLGQPVLQGLDLNAVQAIEILRGPQTLRIEQDDAVWRVSQAFGYPADLSVLRRNLMELNDLKIDHIQRGYRPAPDLQSTQVRLLDEQDRPLCELRLTARGAEGFAQGRYVVRDDGADGWLVKSDLSGFTPEVRSWIDNQVLSLPAHQVRRIEMVPDDGPPVTFERQAGKLHMLHLAETEQFDDSHAYGIESALSHLSFQDVVDPELDDTVTGLSTGAVFRVTSDRDLVYSLRIGKRAPTGNARYARLWASLATPPPPPDAAEIDDEADGTEPQREAEEAVRTFNQRHEGWIYTLATHSAGNMTRPRAELVKPAPPPDDLPEPDLEPLPPQPEPEA